MSLDLIEVLGLLFSVVPIILVGITYLHNHYKMKKMERQIDLTTYKWKEIGLDNFTQEIRINLNEVEKIKKELTVLQNSSKFKSSIAKAADFTFNYKAYSLVKDEIKKRASGEDNTFPFTSLIVKHTSKANTLSYFYLILSYLAYLLLSIFGLSKEGPIIPILIVVMAMIVFIRQRILIYRIKRGLYGSNENEVREILNFVLDEKNKHHFGGKGGKSPVFDISNLEELENNINDYKLEGVKA